MRMNSKLKVKLNPIILKEKRGNELKKCSCCRDFIYGEMYRVWIEMESETMSPPLGRTDTFLCESCALLINKTK